MKTYALILIFTLLNSVGQAQVQSMKRLEVEELVVKRPDGKGYVVIGFSEGMHPEIRICDADSTTRILMTTAENQTTISICNRSAYMICRLQVDDTTARIVASDIRVDSGTAVSLSTTRREDGCHSSMSLLSDSGRSVYESFMLNQDYQERVYFSYSGASSTPECYRHYRPWGSSISLGYPTSMWFDHGSEEGIIFLSTSSGGRLLLKDDYGVPRAGIQTSNGALGPEFYVNDSTGFRKAASFGYGLQESRPRLFLDALSSELYLFADSNNAGLEIRSNGRERFWLYARPAETVLAMARDDKSVGLDMVASGAESRVALYGFKAKNMMQLQVTAGSTHVSLFDSSARLRALLGSESLISKNPRGEYITPISSIHLFDESGSILFKEP